MRRTCSFEPQGRDDARCAELVGGCTIAPALGEPVGCNKKKITNIEANDAVPIGSVWDYSDHGTGLHEMMMGAATEEQCRIVAARRVAQRLRSATDAGDEHGGERFRVIVRRCEP